MASKPPSPADQRAYPRYQVTLRVHMADLGEVTASVTKDFSEGGVFLHTSAYRPPGSLIPLALIDPTSSEEIPVMAQVIHVKKNDAGEVYGLGTQFLHLDDSLAEKIRKLVRLIAEETDPAVSLEEESSPETVPSAEEELSPHAYNLMEMTPRVGKGAGSRQLTPIQTQLLAFINGKSRIDAIIRASGLRVGEAVGALTQLIKEKVIEIPRPEIHVDPILSPPVSSPLPSTQEKSPSTEPQKPPIQKPPEAPPSQKRPQAHVGPSLKHRPIIVKERVRSKSQQRGQERAQPASNDHLTPEETQARTQFTKTRVQEYLQKANAALDYGKLAESVRLLQLALNLNPPNAGEIHLKLADIAFRYLRNVSLAERHALSAISLMPENEDARSMLNKIHHKDDQPMETRTPTPSSQSKKEKEKKGLFDKLHKKEKKKDSLSAIGFKGKPTSKPESTTIHYLLLATGFLAVLSWNYWKYFTPHYGTTSPDMTFVNTIIPLETVTISGRMLQGIVNKKWYLLTSEEQKTALENFYAWSNREHNTETIYLYTNEGKYRAVYLNDKIRLYR